MILQKLHDLYPHLEKDDAYDLAPEGFSSVSVSFVIELEPDGTAAIQDIREGTGNQRHGRTMTVPGAKAHSNSVEAFPFRDTATYLLGFHQGTGKPENTAKRFHESKRFHQELAQLIPCEDIQAVARFFDKWTPDQASNIDPKILLNSGVFRLRGKHHFVHETPVFRDWWKEHTDQPPTQKAEERFCLITGKYLPIALTHSPAIGGGMPSPAQSKAALVSFNFRSADSYGNDSLQGLNAPVSEEAATKYCKALNTLLADPRHRIQVGDATTVFWTETPTATQFSVTRFLSGNHSPENDPEAKAQDTVLRDALASHIAALRQGLPPPQKTLPEGSIAYHVLGLTGQAGGRIGIRFHHTGTLEKLVENIALHHADLGIVKEWDDTSKNPDPDFPAVWQLLRQTAREAKEIPPTLGGALMRAILTGGSYPAMLQQRVIGRIRVNEKDRHDKPIQKVNYFRAAILKAFLNRNYLNKSSDKKMSEAIDLDRKEPAYHLGRLFAVYETAQKHAHDWKLERTIRETMYASASATPLAVFGRLERLHHHHTAKKSHPSGSSESYADIVAKIEQHFKGGSTPYPASLGLIDQSFFAVGYYHQLQHFKNLSNARKETSEVTE